MNQHHDPANPGRPHESQDQRRHAEDAKHHPGRSHRAGSSTTGAPEASGDQPTRERREHRDKYAGAQNPDFAREHDPAQHDIAAGEDARQPGDWTAEDAGGPQVWDSEGNLVEGEHPGAPDLFDVSGHDSTAGRPASGDHGADGAQGSSGARASRDGEFSTGGRLSTGGQSGTDAAYSTGGQLSPGGGDAAAPSPGGTHGASHGDHRGHTGLSTLEEVRDGGYGVGSAARFEDGRMPLGHPVKAWEDTKTYATQEHHAFATTEPHLWFTDPGAAERAGFRRAD